MPAEVLTVAETLEVDSIAKQIANQWQTWDMMRSEKKHAWAEVRKYKYATDTTTTTNSQLPWKNKTTYPKLTQIADNLKANYLQSLFPKRRWLVWEGYDKQSEQKDKKDVITQYMESVIDGSGYKTTMGMLLDDWIDYGNCFSTVEWVDQRVMQPNGQQAGYVGPRIVRISPFDIVFNPIANNFQDTAKIVRKFVTMGDLKAEITRLSPTEEASEKLWKYLTDIRSPSHAAVGADTSIEDDFLRVDGFMDFRSYLGSDYAEVLTFYGDLFVRDTGELHRNVIITVVDRHKLILNEPNPTLFGKAQIFHSAWRPRQDNLWGMGPLDNLVGMQYRIDHLENLKADVFDLNAFPPLKIKGLLNDDFEWGPMERIYVGDDGDVEMVAPHFEILNANLEIETLEKKMEEIAGAPKEAMGIRSPGEKTKYEVQRLENASGRIFVTRLNQIEDQQVEPQMTAMLELARRKMVSTELRMFDTTAKVATFQTISVTDIIGNGRIKPIAAKHFAEQADLVQNLTAFANSAVGQDQAVSVHISGLGLAKLFEELLEAERFNLVQPFVRIAEAHEAQNLQNVSQQQSQMQSQTPIGLTPEDRNGLPGGPPATKPPQFPVQPPGQRAQATALQGGALGAVGGSP